MTVTNIHGRVKFNLLGSEIRRTKRSDHVLPSETSVPFPGK